MRNYKDPFTGSKTTWMITFDSPGGEAKERANFLIPFPYGTPEHGEHEWLNVTELEDECREHMESLENLEALNNALIEMEQELAGSAQSENLDIIINHFQEILRRLTEEREK